MKWDTESNMDVKDTKEMEKREQNFKQQINKPKTENKGKVQETLQHKAELLNNK